MEEVLAELAFACEFFEIAMGGDDNADIDADGLVSTDALDFAFFEDAKELCLHRQRHIADLVEEQRAAMRLLKLSDMPSRRAGERAFFVSEEFRLDQFGREQRRNSG